MFNDRSRGPRDALARDCERRKRLGRARQGRLQTDAQEAHAAQTSTRVPGLHLQLLAALLPLVEFAFEGQSTQVEACAAPTAEEYLPAPQSTHAALPSAALYLPAKHAVHGPPAGPEKPAAHSQSVAASLPVAERELEGQLWQVLATVAPVAVEYFPAPQSAQVVFSVSTAARIPNQPIYARIVILMYCAVTGWLKMLEVFKVLEYVVGRKNRVVPSAAVAVSNFDVLNEYCTRISVAHHCSIATERSSALHCVITP